MVAAHGNQSRQGQQKPQRGFRIRTVADDIAEADETRHPLVMGVIDALGQCLEVAVDIRNDGDLHGDSNKFSWAPSFGGRKRE